MEDREPPRPMRRFGIWEERTASASALASKLLASTSTKPPDLEPLGSTSGARWAQKRDHSNRSGRANRTVVLHCTGRRTQKSKGASAPVAERAQNGASLHRSPNRARTLKQQDKQAYMDKIAAITAALSLPCTDAGSKANLLAISAWERQFGTLGGASSSIPATPSPPPPP